MFNNLIESSSHAREFKRRASFLMFTTATYFVLLLISGVASIYAYDARLEDQTLEVVTLLPAQELGPEVQIPPAAPRDRPRNTKNHENAVPERAVAMLSVNHPESVPEKISAAPNKNLPLPDHGPVAITGRDRDSGAGGGPTSPFGSGRTVVQPAQVVRLTELPPPAENP